MNEKILYFASWLTTNYINLGGNKQHDFKNILIIKMDEIGDLVTALPVFYNLHQWYPNAQQTLVCKSFNNTFFKHLDYVSCVNDFNEVANKTYDLVIDLRGTTETLQYCLSKRPHYRLDRGSIRLLNKFNGGQKNEIDTNIQIIEPLQKKSPDLSNEIKLSEKERRTVSDYLALQGIDKYIIMHLGARDEARRWPADRFAHIINYINTAYSIPCVLVGGPDDNEVNNACLKLVKSKHNYNVVGEFDLLAYSALCEKATLFIGNESGPLHIASAMNTPCIALFGPGVKDVFYPKGEHVKIHHYFLSRGHKQQTIENSTIFQITLNEVKESVDTMLKRVF